MTTFDHRLLRFAWENLSFPDRMKANRRSQRTVWVLGAGASHHYSFNVWGAPVPLASSFFKSFHDLPTSWGLHARVGEFTRYLQMTRGIAPIDIPHWSENIESFMTSIEQQIVDLREKKSLLTGPEGQLVLAVSSAFNNMTFILANVLNESQNGVDSPYLLALLRHAGPHDQFVTFNWDTLLDRSLAATGCWTPSAGYGVQFSGELHGAWGPAGTAKGCNLGGECSWKLWKLHGSTNWLVPYSGVGPDLTFTSIIRTKKVFLYWHSSFAVPVYRNRWRGGYVPTCYGYYPPNLPATMFDPQELQMPDGHTMVQFVLRMFTPYDEGADTDIPSAPLLVAPVKNKLYAEYAHVLDPLWAGAREALTAADRIVILGYSFPATDTRARELLWYALSAAPGSKDLVIVDPSAEDVRMRLDPSLVSLARSIETHCKTLEDYVDELDEGVPARMEEMIVDNREIADWLKLLEGLYRGGMRPTT